MPADVSSFELAVFEASVVLLGVGGAIMAIFIAAFRSSRSARHVRSQGLTIVWAIWLVATAIASISEAWQVDTGSVLGIPLQFWPPIMLLIGLAFLVWLLARASTARIGILFEEATVEEPSSDVAHRSATVPMQPAPGVQSPPIPRGASGLGAGEGPPQYGDSAIPVTVPVTGPVMVAGPRRETFNHIDDFYVRARELHKSHDRLRVAANTPGLLLPSEERLSPAKKRYFEMIWSRLEGPGAYELDYLFDTDGVERMLRTYRTSNQEDLIQDTRRHLQRAMRAVGSRRLRLRHRRFGGHLNGMIIVGEEALAHGTRSPGDFRTSNWVIDWDPSLAQLQARQFEDQFDSPSLDMTVEILDSMLRDLPNRPGPVVTSAGAPPDPPAAPH